MLNVFQPSLGQAEIEAVTQTIASNWIGKGKRADEFEAAWAAHIGVDPPHCLAITSCTEGLFQAMELLDIGPGNEVIIPTIHFIGAANAVLAMGATPVFCDVNPHTLNADSFHILEKVTDKTRAVILLHYGGEMADLDRLNRLPFKIKIIEDCACSPASSLDGIPAGRWGDISVWSFDAMKIMSTGDGGMMYVKKPELLERARLQTYLGMGQASGLSNPAGRWWEFEACYPGRRAAMNDLTAAIGLEQLKKLPGFVAKRRQLWQMYNERLVELPWLTIPLPVPGHVQSSYYFYWIQLERRDELAAHLRKESVYTTFRYWPLHLALRTGESLPNAEWAARHTLLLPLHQGLTDGNVDYICDRIKEFDSGPHGRDTSSGV